MNKQTAHGKEFVFIKENNIMDTNNDAREQEKQHKHAAVKPDSETLHKTDPQENMKGPVSSFIQGIKHVGEKSNKESKKEADTKRDEHM
ncbi:MAG: hypothetical protein QM687_01365 [Ferruginibacter sp.]